MKLKETDLIFKDRIGDIEIRAQCLELDRQIAADELEFKKQKASVD